MGAKTYTIGDLARLTGQPVRRIRFYSDKGLLPPALRSESNYRFYTDEDVAKLDLIHALREAGVSLETIERLMARRLSLSDVLKTRLDVLEAEIAAKHRMAAALRATLRVPNPAEGDLRRIWTMSKVSNQQMNLQIERFIDRIAEGTTLNSMWRRQVLDMSLPELPDDPTAEQLSAWDELAALVSDPSFEHEVHEGTKAFWTDDLDAAAYKVASTNAYAAAVKGVGDGLSPQSAHAQAVAREWLEGSAHALGRKPDHTFREWHFTRYERNAGRLGRYRELVAILHGDTPIAADRKAWAWLNEAIRNLPLSD